MTFDFPLVVFTVFSQLGVGLAIFLCWNMFAKKDDSRHSISKAWLWCCCISVFALLASFFHLGHPFAAWKALLNLGVSWLSLEGLLFGCFCGLAFICIFWHARFMALLTAAVGVAALVSQGITYAPPSMPAINNAFPLVLFLFSAFAMGACCERLMLGGKSVFITRPLTLVLLVILLMAPVFWAAGSATMQLTTADWIASPLFWIGAACILAAIIISFIPKMPGFWQLASLVCGLFLTRMVFFADTIHTAANLGLPYN